METYDELTFLKQKKKQIEKRIEELEKEKNEQIFQVQACTCMPLQISKNRLLIAERFNDGIFNDMNIYLANIEKEWLQDLASIRFQNNKLEVLVWADENDEDYTHKFEIKEYQGE